MSFHKKNLFSALIIFIFIIFFLKYNLFSFYIPPVKNSFGDIVKFADWTVIVDLAKCFQLGVNVFSSNTCDVAGRPHVYGTILLYLPLAVSFYEYYIFIIPLIIIFSLILIINIFFQPKSFLDYLTMIFIILSTPLILAIERLNAEIIIFFFIIFLSLINNSKIQKVIVLLLSSIKFYPVTLVLFFFFQKLQIKSFIKNLVYLIIILICFYFDKDQILSVFSKRNIINPSSVDNIGSLIFSFYGIPELMKSIILHIKFFIIKKNEISYLVYNISLLFIIFFVLFRIFRHLLKIDSNNQSEFIFNFEHFEDKLFVFSIILILTVYFISMNYVYKEIYFLGLIPMLRKKIIKNKNTLSKKIYNLIKIKFIFFSFLWFVQLIFFSNSLYFKGLNILIKNVIDLYLVTILLTIFSSLLLFFLKMNFTLNKK